VTRCDGLLLQEIDAYVEKAKDQSCTALIALASRGFAFVTNLIVSTAAKVCYRTCSADDQRALPWRWPKVIGNAAVWRVDFGAI